MAINWLPQQPPDETPKLRYQRMRKKPLWTSEADNRLRELWAAGVTVVEIAKDIGCSDAYVSMRANLLQLKSRRPKRTYLSRCAERRGISVEQLNEKVLQAVVDDMLVDAILDDADELPPLKAEDALEDLKGLAGKGNADAA